MNFLQTSTALSRIDSRNILRDPLLGWIVLFAIGFGVSIRLATPPLTGYLQQRYGFDLTPYHILIISSCLLATPVIIGTVVGFLLLDQRDDHTLDALRVTPMTVPTYLAYRVVVPMILCVVFTFVTISVADFVGLDTWLLAITSLVSAPLAPLVALTLASFAQNKVQGFALAKASSVVTTPPVIAFFVNNDWQLVFGLLPTFWGVKAFWAGADGGSIWYYLVIAVFFQAVLLWWLVGKFQRVVAR